MRSKINIIKKLVTLFAVISITAFTALNLYAQPSWDAVPTMTNITALNGDLTVDLDVNCTVYYVVFRYVTGVSAANIKAWSPNPHNGNSGGFRGGGSFAYTAGGSITQLVEHLVPTDLGSYTHSIHIVAETAPDVFSPVQAVSFTTTNCPDVNPLTVLTSAGKCVNLGAVKTYNIVNLLGVLKGANWTIEWGDGSADYTYVSSANGDVPNPNPSHSYSSHDSCFYEITLTATNIEGCAAIGGLVENQTPVLHGRDVATDGNGEMLLVNDSDGSPDTIKVCEGNEAFITLRDDGTWDCDENFHAYPPGELNSPDRDVQFVYGMHPQTQAVENTITGDVTITGAYPGTANGAAGHASGIINIDTDVMSPITNPNTTSDVIHIPTSSMFGEYIHVYFKNWNKCNPYGGDPWDGTAVWDSIVIYIIDSPDASMGADFAICETDIPGTTITMSATGGGGTGNYKFKIKGPEGIDNYNNVPSPYSVDISGDLSLGENKFKLIQVEASGGTGCILTGDIDSTIITVNPIPA
ncbi:MAG: hypothetical protein KAX05_01680, partial [Bacteroidales bacterium]|nr:hypothetical protein [Bacteroidales bacterium]